MANGGTFRITQLNFWLDVSWVRTSYSSVDNTSTIQWTSKITSNNSYQHAVYGLNINGDFVGSGGTNIGENPLSGTYTVQHNDLEDATLVFSGSIITDFSNTQTVSAVREVASILTATNFNDEESPEISYSNPAGEDVSELRGYITWSGGSLYKSLPKEATKYIFDLTETEREPLREAITSGETLPVNFYIETIYGDTVYTSGIIGRTMTLVNYEPILNPSVVDINTTTLNLTGDENILIQGFSNAYFDSGAQAVKGAIIDHQRISNGSTVLNDYQSNTGVFEAVSNNYFAFRVVDNRGNKTYANVVKDINTKFIQYVKLTSVLKLDYLTLAGEIGLTVSGNYFNNTFGAEENYLTFKYFLVENGSEIGTFSMDPEIVYNGNSYTATYAITGLNPENNYEVYVDVTDALMHVQSNAEAISATPIFDWGKEDFNHNTDVYIKQGKAIKTHNSYGLETEVLGTNDSSDSITLGWGNYDNEQGSTEIYGNLVSIQSRDGLLIDGREYGQNQILWQGVSTMNQFHTITLHDSISNQPNGVVLVFSLYTLNSDTERWEEQDVSIHSFFVSKKEVELLPNAPHTFFLMINSGFSVLGAKYIYIDDTTMSGHATNTTSGSNNNITFNNNRFVLRYVIGV